VSECKPLADGCREAGELAASLKEQEEQAEALFAKMREVMHVPPSLLARVRRFCLSALQCRCRAHRRATLTTLRRLVLNTFSSLTLVVCVCCSHALAALSVPGPSSRDHTHHFS
jgi:hypothetical protein